MKKPFSLILVLGLLWGAPANAKMTIIKCGGYVGYDEKFIYLNWQEDKKQFRDKISIRERSDKYIMATLPTSDKIEIKNNGRYITYYVYGRERINYLCTKVKLEDLY
jgi:hypothetical protein